MNQQEKQTQFNRVRELKLINGRKVNQDWHEI